MMLMFQEKQNSINFYNHSEDPEQLLVFKVRLYKQLQMEIIAFYLNIKVRQQSYNIY